MNGRYEKPSMKIVSLRNQEAVADTCWGNHGTGVFDYFYDGTGKGYIKFQIDGGSCALQTGTLYYYDSDNPSGTALQPGTPEYSKWIEDIKSNGKGNSGNAVQGDGTIFSDNPGGMS